jgi:serine/threonine-protein kinase
VILGGRYRVERELGRGGMAKVFEGTDTVLGRRVAIKILAPQFAEDEAFVQRFRREAQAAARIGNPHIVSVFDTGSDDGVHYIVMEFVEGRTLADYLAGGGRVLPERAIGVAQDVCEALAAAHAQGVIHRDIKPGNIMLDPRGQVKVTDFGIARMTTTAETVAQTAAILGTASYLSPEQAQGQPVDGRSDIYSLGCVLYEMVTGRPPFLGETPVTVASKQVLEQPVPPSTLNGDVPADLDAVILRALAKNPANRYTSAEELRADLERVRTGLPVEATPLLPSSTTQVLDRSAQRTEALPPPEPRRPRRWVPVVVTLVIVGLLGVGLWVAAAGLLSEDQAPAQVTVPSVIGERRADAEDALTGAGLTVGQVAKDPAADHPGTDPGTVVDQDPAAGTQVAEGTAVNLTIVAQPEAVGVPTVVGLQASAAQLVLEQAGFVVQQEPEASSDVEEGLVIRTQPTGGTEAEPGSTVTMFVSTGPGTVAVPEVRCLAFNSALNRLQQAGLSGVISSDTVDINPSCPLGNKVAAQDPAPGEQVPLGSTVTLFAGQATSPTPVTGPTGPTGV